MISRPLFIIFVDVLCIIIRILLYILYLFYVRTYGHVKIFEKSTVDKYTRCEVAIVAPLIVKRQVPACLESKSVGERKRETESRFAHTSTYI